MLSTQPTSEDHSGEEEKEGETDSATGDMSRTKVSCREEVFRYVEEYSFLYLLQYLLPPASPSSFWPTICVCFFGVYPARVYVGVF